MKVKFILAACALTALCAFGASANTANTATTATPNAATPDPYAPPANYAVPQHYTQGLPSKITQTIQQMYPGAFIVDMDWEAYGYEIELSNRMEMHFDRNGNLLGQKWDD